MSGQIRSTLGYLLKAGLLICAIEPVFAGVEIAAKNASHIQSETQYFYEATKTLPGKRLRCWQEGRLIYETNNAVDIEKTSEGDNRPLSPNSAVQLFDFKQGLCILESVKR